MTSQKAATFVLLLVALSSAFNVEDTFYSYEENVTVSYTNFTSNGNQYSIISLDGNEVFLLENGTPLLNQAEISSIISNYYLNAYYPSEDEIQELRDLLDAYNASRNDGQKFVGKEEYVCREVLFIDGRVKAGTKDIYCRNEDDEELCESAAMLMYQFLSAVSGVPPVSSPEFLLDPIQEFGFASYGTDEVLDTIDEKFDDAENDKSKMLGALQYTQTSITTLENNLADLEGSLFGWTENKLCDSDHWCLCPDIDLNDSVLDDIDEHSADLIEKMGPYDIYEEVATNIYTESTERMAYMETEKQAQEYLSKLESLNETATEVITLGEEADTRVSNISLSQKLSRLKTLHMAIPDEITNKDFETTADDLDEYEILIANVNEAAISIITIYNGTRDAKNSADALIVLLETKELDPISMESLDILENKSSDLDAEFRDGLTTEELKDLEIEYINLGEEAQQLLSVESHAPTNRVLLLFRGFARNVNTGIANFAATTEVIDPSEIPQNSLFTLGLFSALVFLSLSSITLLLFLYVVATTQFSIPQTSHVLASAFLSILILLLGFSAFMYLFLGKTSTDATLPEFLAEFESKNSTAIMIDLRNSSYSDGVVMNTCASSLAATLENQNKSLTIYKLTNSGCTQIGATNTTLNTTTCFENLDAAESSFLLEYSPTNEPPQFSIIYNNKAEIKANNDYYDSCPLVALFS
ncbi:hypothetical protein KKB44_04205 [Candidatus Micrarchaeota archaeon]|nr:hypothetical protein [Candidatus Micrarchaeota archaeon]